ncbi:Blue-light-activated protein [Roseisalinus antarcticus]|uniref:histidine kinase n=2 Tax=Roseisalinus antarcticus TaxID=254357 RepID=A0A1Y5TSC3_9RHOB|nr:Blue-light-activated protein [Roseisalinus antarcticus]
MFVFEQRRADAEVEIEAVYSELELALATLAVRMSGMATALERDTRLTPDNFTEIYEDATETIERPPERALAFMPDLASIDQVNDFFDALGTEYAQAGYPEFAIFPAEVAAALFPVILVEPAESRQNVFGYNMGTSPERLGAARAALAQGLMTTSGPVALSQDADLSQASFLMLYPVFFGEGVEPMGVTQAILGAGMTPADLFANHVALHDEHTMLIEIGIAGVDLPVRLGDDSPVTGLTVSLIEHMEMPVIRTGGFDMPFRASVSYAPRALDAVLPFIAAAFVALLGASVLRLLWARATAQRTLESALVRRESELADAYRIQSRSQRIEALGRLVGGVAHDFNNILSVVLGNIELLKEEGGRADPMLLDEAEKATLRGAHLTRQLLAVGLKSHLEPQRLDVTGTLHDAANMMKRVLPESIELATIPAAGLWPVELDPNGLQNALLNLALNSRDAMDGRGKLTMEASNTRITQDYLQERPDEAMPPGRYVVVSVSDTGAGMAPEVVDRAFEPFFTTKHATDGSGLGLPSVLGFCRQSGGSCRIYSEPGVGTTVRMYFPASDPRPIPAKEREPEPQYPTGGARILLAEDEDAVARILVQHLNRAGYTVKRVSTGDAAWAELERQGGYDMLITDLVMPGAIQGAELARRVERDRPKMAVLLISGYPQEAAIEGNGVATRHPVLTKPIPRAILLEMIETLRPGT